MKRSILVLSMIAMVGLSAIAQPQPQRRGANKQMKERMGGERQEKRQGKDRLQKMVQMLELSDEQKSKIKDIHFNSMKSMKSVKNEMGEKMARLKTLTSADNPDNKAIKSLAQNIGDLRSKMFVNQVETKQKVRALLDEKQQMKFDMMKDYKMKRGQ